MLDIFGDIVRGHRRRLGLSQEDLAGQTGLSVRNLSNIESGRVGVPRPVTVRLLHRGDLGVEDVDEPSGAGRP